MDENTQNDNSRDSLELWLSARELYTIACYRAFLGYLTAMLTCSFSFFGPQPIAVAGGFALLLCTVPTIKSAQLYMDARDMHKRWSRFVNCNP